MSPLADEPTQTTSWLNRTMPAVILFIAVVQFINMLGVALPGEFRTRQERVERDVIDIQYAIKKLVDISEKLVQFEQQLQITQRQVEDMQQQLNEIRERLKMPPRRLPARMFDRP
jgi:hypothetical protein